jgi:aspartate oxidase
MIFYLEEVALSIDNIHILTSTLAESLILDDNLVKGVKISSSITHETELRANAVIIATGGYAADRSQ